MSLGLILTLIVAVNILILYFIWRYYKIKSDAILKEIRESEVQDDFILFDSYRSKR